MAVKRYDSIVIGAGHNGLVCASYLARAGQCVLLLEAAARPGGLAAPREFAPGFRVALDHGTPGLNPRILRELGLAPEAAAPGTALPLVALAPGQPPLPIPPDGSAAPADAAAWQRLQRDLQRFAAALAPFWQTTLPRIGSGAPRDLFTYGRLGLRLRRLGREDMLEFFRVAMLPARDLADEYFEDERLKAAFCWEALVGSKLAPRSPNQALLTLLARMAGPLAGARGLPAQGPGALVEALVGAASAAGVDLRSGAAVERILVHGDEHGQRCRGVRLAGGETIESPRVISSADPKTTFLGLLGAPQLEIEFSNRIRRLRCEGYVAKLHLALRGLPRIDGLDRPQGRLLMAPSMDAIEFAYDDAKYGEASQEPVMEVMLPSLAQPALAPAGQHVLSAQIMYVPARRRGGWDRDARAALRERVMALLERHAPGIGALVLHEELLTPADIEREYRVSGGHWHHVEPAVDQLLMMRPTWEAAQYATPLPGLWLCGAGCHPGGDLTGNPGRNAAREILR